jgi:S1-C subfamily serine protease
LARRSRDGDGRSRAGGYRNHASATRPPFTVGIQFQPHEDGAEVVAVVGAGPAEAAGVQAGDIILAVNGREVGEDITAALMPGLRTGEALVLDLVRQGRALSITVKPRARP